MVEQVIYPDIILAQLALSTRGDYANPVVLERVGVVPER